jgi:signal transduction histidine kinase
VRAVRLNVLDNGGGFPDKVLKRAFEPYVTTKTKGTGLGLAVVKKIADEHGARVRIGNRPAPTAEGPLEGLDSALEAPRGANPAPGPVGAQVSLSFSKLELLGDPPAPDPTQLTLPLPSSNLH